MSAFGEFAPHQNGSGQRRIGPSGHSRWARHELISRHMILRFSMLRVRSALTAALVMLALACMWNGVWAAPPASRVTDVLARPEAFAGRKVEVSGVLSVQISSASLYTNS